MTSFKMKILGFASGSYTVEYIPDSRDCSPIKLNIKLDQSVLDNQEAVIEKLKASAPIDYWNNQLSNMGSNVAQRLINTEHVVENLQRISQPSAPGNFMDMNSIPTSASSFSSVTGINFPQTAVGQSTPEEVVSVSEQDVIKLKILIQQVLQEMAEGTV